MSDFDELRAFAEGEDQDGELDDDFFDQREQGETGDKKQFLGMSPVERMFIAIFFFMNVAVLGVAILLLTGRL